MLEAAGWEESGSQKRLQDMTKTESCEYRVGRKVCSGFSMRCCRKTWTNFLANPILKSFELLLRLTSHLSPRLSTGQLHKYPRCRGCWCENHTEGRGYGRERATRWVLPENSEPGGLRGGRLAGTCWGVTLGSQWQPERRERKPRCLRFAAGLLVWYHLDSLIPTQPHCFLSVFKTLDQFIQLKCMSLISSPKFWSSELPSWIQLKLIHILTSISYLKIEAKYTTNAPIYIFISLNCKIRYTWMCPEKQKKIMKVR